MECERVKPENGWDLIKLTPNYTVWAKGEFVALSSVVFISDEYLPPHWEWLVSFSAKNRKRINNQKIKPCLADFKATDFEEDNHENGIARKFWKAVEPQYREPCPCKDEIIIKQDDYEYSQKRD